MPEMNTKQPRQSTRRSAWPRWIAAAAVTAMLATACASESGSTSDTADAPVSAPACLCGDAAQPSPIVAADPARAASAGAVSRTPR